jgi:cobalt-zinc-cadmium efflux system membrane fusion protein
MRTDLLINISLLAVIICSCKEKKSEAGSQDEPGNFSCSGYSFVQNEGTTEITAPFSGKIQTVFVDGGQEVKNGERLAVIENTDFLLMQQEYLEAKNLLEYFSEEYTRQGNLTVENATSMKKMQTAKRDFQSAELKYKSLRTQLIIMKVNPDSLSPDKLKTALVVRSTGNGLITEKFITTGSYVEKGEKLFSLASGQTILIKLEVPEELYMQVQKDQKIDIRSIADTAKIFPARVLSVSNSINPETHMAEIIAIPDEDDQLIIPGMSVTANIFTE